MSKYVNYDELLEKIKHLPIPAINDAVDIVRCKDCIYFDIKNSANQGTCDCGYRGLNYDAELYTYPNDFCSYGIRRE